MFFLSIPFDTYFKLNEKSSFSVGLAPQWRASKSGILNYVYTNTAKNIEENANVRVKTINLQLSAAYQYQIQPKLTIEPFVNSTILSDDLYLSYEGYYLLNVGLNLKYKLF